jgi:dCMP deaminase
MIICSSPRPGWGAYYMNIAKEVAKRSHDVQTKVGAVLVNSRNHIIGTGYNGFPPGLDDASLPVLRPDKYPYIIHAEMNAIIHAEGEVKGGELYVTHSPCLQCTKLIIASQIKTVYYDTEYVAEDTDLINSLMNLCGINLWRL